MTNNKLLFIFFIVLPILFNSCKRDIPFSSVVDVSLLYKNNESFKKIAYVLLYYSKDSLDRGKYKYAALTSNSSKGIAQFTNLAPGHYYILGHGEDNWISYSGTAEFTVVAGQAVKLNLELQPNGSLRVIVKERNAHGSVKDNADISIYLTEQHFWVDKEYTHYRIAVDDPQVGILITDIEAKTYYIKVSFKNWDGQLNGIDTVSVPYNKETVKEIICY